MGESEWGTPYSTWIEKTGRKEKIERTGPKQSVSWAIERGNRLEPAARARYELINSIDMPPKVFVHPQYPYILASLDGWNEEKKLVLELKVPGKEVWEEAKTHGRVHKKYLWQLEHQCLVTGAELVHFYVVKVDRQNGRDVITDGALVEYAPNPEMREKLLAKLHEFWGFVQSDTPPPLTERDTLILDDPKAKEIFNEVASVVREHEIADQALIIAEDTHSRAKAAFESVDKKLSNSKANLTPFMSHVRVRAGDLTVTEKTFKNDRKAYWLKVHG